jgi:L-fucose isomerase-like protein
VQSRSKLLKVLPILVCRKGQVKENFMEEKMKQLGENLKVDVQILKDVIINEEQDITRLKENVEKADVILLYKPHLGLGNCVVKISDYNLPIILFNDEGMINNPLDALEYVYPKEKVWVAIDYQDINNYFSALSTKKKMEQTKILILNADYPHWERFLCRIQGGREAIKEKLGIELEYVKSEEVIKRWENMDEKLAKSIVEKWMKEAEKIVEPEEKDIMAVAKLYLVMKDLLEEKNAHAITMAYGENPLPVPCVAYTNLRDMGVPSACEADIISLLSMIILNYIAEKPCFMGNTFIDMADEALIISHCVCPRKMEGYNANAVPYTLRRYHREKFTGSLTAFVKMKAGQEVTLCRLSGDLKSMLIANGVIADCVEMDDDTYCRVKAKVKIKNPKEFIHKTSGNHHVMVYGDYREQLRKLNEVLGIATIEVYNAS